MRKLRLSLSKFLEYEDVGILLYDKRSASYLAVSPNLDQETMRKSTSLSIFNYNPETCLSLQFLASKQKSELVSNPREQRSFLEGVDNLSPVNLTDPDCQTRPHPVCS